MLRRSLRGVLVGLFVLGCAGPPKPAESARPKESAPLSVEPPTGPDLAKLESAIAAMDRGDTARAIRNLEELRTRHPENAVVLHELALAYRLAKQPKQAVDLLLPFRARLPPTAVAGLGSALDELGQSSEALAVLREGLGRYPDSGLLHAEVGTTLLNQGKVEEAVELYHRGIEVDPRAPANYLRLSLVFSHTDQRGLSLVLGETFRLLEPTTRRSADLARVMVEVCRDSVKSTQKEDGSVESRVTLAPSVEMEGVEDISKLPFVNVFELAFAPHLVRAHREGFSLATLHQARVAFVGMMNDSNSPFDWGGVPVFRFMREANANGMLELYDYWLFGPGFPEEFETWANANRSSAEVLGRYMAEHPLFPAPSR